MVRVPSLPAAEEALPRFSIWGFDKAIVFVASLDPLVAALVTLFGKRQSFVRFCALQRLATLFLFDLPLGAAFMTLLWMDTEHGPLPGMPWTALALIALMVVLLVWKIMAATAAKDGKVYLVPGVRRIARRWVPRDPSATGLGTKTATHAGLPESPQVASATRARMPFGIKVVLGVFAVPFVAFIGWVAYASAVGPGLAAQRGTDTPARFIATLRTRGLLSPSEMPIYFYSDGFMDIEEGLYFFTDKKLVTYSESRDPKAVVVPLSTIEDLSFVKATGLFDDSGTIIIKYGGGSALSMRVSHELQSDGRFYAALHEAWKKQR